MFGWLKSRLAAGSRQTTTAEPGRAAQPPEPTDAPPSSRAKISAPVAEVVQLALDGRSKEAEAMAKRLLAQDSDHYDAIVATAIVASRRSRAADARKGLDRAIATDPDRAEAHLQLAMIHLKSGQRNEARRSLLAATDARHSSAEAFFRLGEMHREDRDRTGAIAAYRTATELDSAHGEAFNNLGGQLREEGRSDEALAAFRQAVAIRPRLAAAWFNLGTHLRDRGDLDEARGALLRCIELEPRQADARYWLGNVWLGLGEAAKAVECYRMALRLDPQMLPARWSLAMGQIVPVPDSAGSELASRNAFSDELDKLAAWCRAHPSANAAAAVAVQQPYYLAYHLTANKDLLEKYGRLCVSSMRPWEAKVGLPAAPSIRGAKCRVGIVSGHFHNHSVWNALIRGWLEDGEAGRIEWHLFHLGSREDSETSFAKRHAARFHSGRLDWTLWAKTISESRLDIAVYPEVGMDPVTGKLAAVRLAPLQMASWGHPETTGLPSIDRFVSAAGMEPDSADRHYSEALVTLPGLGCKPRRFGLKPIPIDRRALGIPPDCRILLCAGMPFKYRPEHDGVLVEIARRTPGCRMVFFRTIPGSLSASLEDRLRAAFTAAGLAFDQHVVFVPWLDHARFFGLLQAADLYVDSLGFSGFNTTMQAIECGLPVAAFEGQFLRGRFASGILQQLDLSDCVASAPSAFVDLVVRLATDDDMRESVRSNIATRRDRLFDAKTGGRAMSEVLLTS